MHLIGQAIDQYARSNGGQLPAGLDALLAQRLLAAETLTCPSSNHEKAHGETFEELVQNFRHDPNHCSVVYLGAGLTSASVTTQRVIAYEYLANHEDGMHVLYDDGKVLWLQKDDAAYVITELKAGQNPPTMESRVRMW